MSVINVIFFFFKQKTAYGMRISDWSSDVCSSELCAHLSSQEGAPVPVVDAMGGLTLEVIGRCGFGYSFDSFHHSDHPFVAALTRSLTYAQKSGIPIPFIGQLLRRTEEKKNTADRALLVETVDGVIAERQRTGERRNDQIGRAHV